MKQRVARWSEHAAPLGKNGRTANRQLALQMLPLTRKLTGADRDCLDNPDWADLGAVEGVASLSGLGVDSSQIRIYSRTRLRMCPETLQLRMAGVAACFATEHCLGQ